jgi:hypothetical protein
MHPRSGDYLACLTLLLLTLGCFARLVVEPGSLIVDGDLPSIDFAQRDDVRPVGNDVTFSFLPRYVQISAALKQTGRLPLWDASAFGGRPLVGNPQGGSFYPPVWLAWWWGSPAALGWLTVAHLLWAGLGVYVLARSLGVGCWAATVAAGCFEASPYLLAQTFEGHYPHVWAASWYAWSFWAYGRHRLGRAWATLALPPILALGFLTGHPQEWYYMVFALNLWALGDALGALRDGNGRRALTGLVVWIGLLSLTLSIVATELIPDMIAQDWTLRSARMAMRQAGRYHLHSINLFQLLGPDALGGPSDFLGDENYWETVLSFGVVPLFLAIVALVRHPGRTAVRGWASLAVLSLVFAAGHRLGLFTLIFELVPGMNRFRVPARSLFLASLGVSVLSGLGVDFLFKGIVAEESWDRLERSSFLAIAVVVTTLIVLQSFGGPFDPALPPDRPLPEAVRYGQAWSSDLGRPDHRGSRAASRLLYSGRFWVALAGTAGVLALGRSGKGPRRRRLVPTMLGALALIELGLHGHALVKVAPAERFMGPDPISEVLRTAAPAEFGPVRIRARDRLYPDIHAFANGVEKVNVHDGFQLQHAADLYQTLYPLLYRSNPVDPFDPMGEAVAEFRRAVRQGVLDRLNVAFLVSDHIDPEPSWPLVATGSWDGNDFAIHRNPTALPRAYVVPHAQAVVDDPAAVLSSFRHVDPRQAVVMRRDPLGPPATGPRQPFTPATWHSASSDRLILRVETEAPGLLVIADTWMPGWSATDNGRPIPILRGNHSQRVIPLRNPGRHQVVLCYEAPGLSRGLTITALAISVWSLASLSHVARRVNLNGLLPAPLAATPIRGACGATIPASTGL